MVPWPLPAATSAQVAHLKKQLEVAERAEAKAHADRQKSKKAESDIDRQALERIRTTSAPPTPSLSQPPLEDI